ncbi:hypothetical protein INS49_003359 [Diaporthe citri]|uniref:uncharacterized protein n=1 Tax=Diaporthe citri TaxID=83186 RepID=UPI001C81DE17|nr:uncharacterized protein INS49_003359 [Diaporthe citri]KAG6355397.1 hypothetical protein INS49_003359 [Diaporthe citri]
MASQVPHGDMGGQNLHLNAVPANANIFHHFLAMPVELQDTVWEEALESPSVLCFTVNSTWSPEDQTQIMCFTPDAHAEASTHHQWALLRTCREARRNVLKFLTVLTLYRPNPSDGKITEYKMPFDSEKTCMCVDGWDGLGMSPEKVGKAKGLGFARDVKRLAFVVHDKAFNDGKFCLVPLADGIRLNDLRGLAFLFHNSLHVSGVTMSSMKIRKLLGDEAFASLFSFQPFVQKDLVEGFYLTKPHLERSGMLDHALMSAFEGWNDRIRSALHQTGLFSILEKINQAYTIELWKSCDPDRYVLAEIDGSCNAVSYLLEQAKRED